MWPSMFDWGGRPQKMTDLAVWFPTLELINNNRGSKDRTQPCVRRDWRGPRRAGHGTRPRLCPQTPTMMQLVHLHKGTAHKFWCQEIYNLQIYEILMTVSDYNSFMTFKPGEIPKYKGQTIYNCLCYTLVTHTSTATSRTRLRPHGANSLRHLWATGVNTVTIVLYYYHSSCACYFKT